MTKKVLSIILAAILLLGVLPLTVSAADVDTAETGVTKITAVSFINVPVPVIGQTPQYAVTLGTTGCHVDTSFDDKTRINGVAWTDKTDHVDVKPTDTFQAGHRYAYGVRITADTGYEFAVSGDWPDVSVTFDGKSASGTNPIVNTEPSKTFNTWYDFPALEPIVINSASFYNVPVPVIGQTPQYAVTLGTTGCHVDTSFDDKTRINGVSWTDKTDNVSMKPTDTFQAGHKYNFNVIFSADTGYQFAVKNNSPDVSVTFNGYAGSGTNTVYQREPSETMCAWYTFSLENYAAVTFNSNGGSGEMEPVYVEKGSTYTLPECTFTPPANKVFSKWAVNGSIPFGTVTQITVNEDTVLEAQWKDAASGTYSITGTATSFLEAGDNTSIVLSKKSGDNYALQGIRTVSGNSGTYGFTGLSNGQYKLSVRKNNHVTREYSVTILLGNKTQDVTICPKGDIDGDGEVSGTDTMLAYRMARGKSVDLDEYALACAEVDGEDGISGTDVMLIYRQARGKHSLF